MAQHDFSTALQRIDDMAAQCKKQGSDVYHRIRLLSAKAFLFARIGRPQKGFSVAVRATAAAQRSMIMPALWEACTALAGVLVGIGQFQAARDVLLSVVYQVSGWFFEALGFLTDNFVQAEETEDVALIAGIQSCIADADMGLAGQVQDDRAMRDSRLETALFWVRSAGQCEFAGF